MAKMWLLLLPTYRGAGHQVTYTSRRRRRRRRTSADR